MSRILANLILVLIVAFTASGVPINTDLLDLDISFPESASPQENENTAPDAESVDEPIKMSFTSTHENHIYNPEQLELTFETPGNELADMTEALAESLNLEVFSAKESGAPQIVKRIQADELKKVLSLKQDSGTILGTLMLDSESLGLKNGHYQLQLSSDGRYTDELVLDSFTVTYYSSIKYTAAQADPAPGYRFLTLYFTDLGKDHLVPVTRTVREGSNLIRTTLNALRDGPAPESGLNPVSPAPYVPVARFSGATQTLTLHTNSYENRDFSSTDEDTYLMMHSLLRTMTSIENISSVKFTVDNKDTEALNGFDLSRPYPRPETVMAYLGLPVSQDRMYMVPVPVDIQSPEEMLSVLKVGLQDYSDLFPPIIPEVEILESSLTDGQLTLVLSTAVLNAYPESSAHGQLMMDCLLASMSTLEGIDTIILKTPERSDGMLFGYPLGSPFEPKLHYNLETP